MTPVVPQETKSHDGGIERGVPASDVPLKVEDVDDAEPPKPEPQVIGGELSLLGTMPVALMSTGDARVELGTSCDPQSPLQLELLRTVMENDQSEVETSTEELFREADLDHNGVLSLEEVQDSLLRQHSSYFGASAFSTRAAVTVHSLLAQRADANCIYEFSQEEVSVGRVFQKSNGVELLGKMFRGPVIAVAAMKGAEAVIKTLISKKADPEVPYSFMAGAAHVVWSGSCINIPIAKGDLKMFLFLEAQGMRIDTQSSIDGKDGATPLWQASYAEKTDIMRYVLKKHPEQIKVAGAFQDNTNVSYTPLHVAAKFGKLAACKILLEYKADVNTEIEDGEANSTPLTEAIDHCHVDVIRLLVANGAGVFCPSTEHAMHMVQNDLITATVARGLQDNPGSIQKFMKTSHLVTFLLTPGDAATRALSAIFVKRRILYWQSEVNKAEVSQQSMGLTNSMGKSLRNVRSTHTPVQTLQKATLMRLEVKTAHIEEDLNVAVGPDHSVFEKLFFSKRTHSVSDDRGDVPLGGTTSEDHNARRARLLRDQLVPQVKGRSQVMVETYQCLLPNIHFDPDVIFALAKSPCDKTFETRGCQAIVFTLWNRSFWYWVNNLATNMMSALVLFVVTLLLNDKTSLTLGERQPPWRWSIIIPMILLWLRHAHQEFMQLVGYARLNRLSDYTCDPLNVMDMARLAMTFMVIAILCFDWEQLEHWSLAKRVLLAATVMLRWFRVLMTLRGFKFIGPRMLPILRASSDVMPFSICVLFPFIAFVNAYFALDITGFTMSALNMYRLGFLGEFDADEFEGLPEDNAKDWDHADRLGTFAVVQALFICASFFMTIVMMNIFIGVLGNSYNAAYSNKDKLFVAERCKMICDWLAVEGQYLKKSTDGECDAEDQYLWYCCAAAVQLGDEPAKEQMQSTVEAQLEQLIVSGQQSEKRLAKLEDTMDTFMNRVTEQLRNKPKVAF